MKQKRRSKSGRVREIERSKSLSKREERELVHVAGLADMLGKDLSKLQTVDMY